MEQLILRPIRGEAEVSALVSAAAADGHRVIGATHVIPDGAGEILGYVSLGGVPMMNLWVDSRRVRARDSLALLGQAEAVLRSGGARAVLVPCSQESPFLPHMERLGFGVVGTTVLHLKKFV